MHGGREPEAGCWIFGYGSLVWRPDLPFLERRPAWIAGWVRRFWQGSTDHRGVPGAPGRVVTLLEEPGGQCYGMAYRLPPEQQAAILERLDHREQGGYERRQVRLHFVPSGTALGLTWIARPDNPNYLGPAPPAVIAEQVRRSSGPSGGNVEYVLRLARALREMNAQDEHVLELARLLEG